MVSRTVPAENARRQPLLAGHVDVQGVERRARVSTPPRLVANVDIDSRSRAGGHSMFRLCENSVVDHAVGGRVATSAGLLVVSLRLASNRKPFRLDSITHRGPRLVDPATPFQQGRRNDPDRNFGVDSSRSGRGRQLPGPIPVPHPRCFSASDRNGKRSPTHLVCRSTFDAGRLSAGGSVLREVGLRNRLR